MRGHLAVIATLIIITGLLVALNAASYVETEREEVETEVNPNRSTFNAGATGTRAFYDLLQESGRKVVRWRESPAALLNGGAMHPQTFVVVGALSVDFEGDESRSLTKWVGQGGRLVVVDRNPNRLLLLAENEGWSVSTSLSRNPIIDAPADDAERLTAGVAPVAPTQPTLLTRGVERVALSRYGSTFIVTPVEDQGRADHASSESGDDEAGDEEGTEWRPGGEGDMEKERISRGASSDTPATQPPRSASPEDVPPLPADDNASSPAPVEHFEKAILVDYRYGAGRIILLGDPFIVANNGITRADNLQLALNLVGGGEGLIAFDEYHHGYGATRNELFAYFAGTPVLWMFAQGALVALVVVWTRGRRFARPLPLARDDRASKLEFIRSMAELQGRARAYDLAIENIYARTRRALARFGGAPVDAPREEVAAGVAARSGMDARGLEELMRECEDAIAGGRISDRKALSLAAALREVERRLGLRLRARELRQAGGR